MLLLPFNLAMVIVSALPLLILLGLVGMAAEALNPTANKPSETTVEVRDAAITAPAEEAKARRLAGFFISERQRHHLIVVIGWVLGD